MSKSYKVVCQYCSIITDNDGFLGRYRELKDAQSVKRKHRYYYGAGHNADISMEWID